MVTMFTLNIFAQLGWDNDFRYYSRGFYNHNYNNIWNPPFNNSGTGIYINTPFGSVGVNIPQRNYNPPREVCVEKVAHHHNESCFSYVTVLEEKTYRLTDDYGYFLGYEKEPKAVLKKVLTCGF